MAPKKTSQSANSNSSPGTEQHAGHTVSKRGCDKAPSRARVSKAKGELPTPLASFEF